MDSNKALASSIIELQELIHELGQQALTETDEGERKRISDNLTALWQLNRERAKRLNGNNNSGPSNPGTKPSTN